MGFGDADGQIMGYEDTTMADGEFLMVKLLMTFQHYSTINNLATD